MRNDKFSNGNELVGVSGLKTTIQQKNGYDLLIDSGKFVAFGGECCRSENLLNGIGSLTYSSF